MKTSSKKVTRITFDCPSDLHSQAKIDAIHSKKTIKDYIIDLIVDKLNENKEHKFIDENSFIIDDDSFNNRLKESLEKDSSLMKKLADR